MTGRAPEGMSIVAAPDEFAVLAEELRAQSTSSGTRTIDQPATATSTPQTPKQHMVRQTAAEKQSEVVKYAALHIAEKD